RAEGPHAGKIVVTGNPVRPAIAAAAGRAYAPPGPGGSFRLLVFGGSQGASFFSGALPEAVARIPEEKRARIRIVQQARREDEERLRGAYAALGVEAEISTFF